MSQKEMEMEMMDREIQDKVNAKGGMQKVSAGTGGMPVCKKNRNVAGVIVSVLWILVCLAAAVALVVALYVPAALPWIVNAGVMCFVVVAAIIADRNIRRWLV